MTSPAFGGGGWYGGSPGPGPWGEYSGRAVPVSGFNGVGGSGQPIGGLGLILRPPANGIIQQPGGGGGGGWEPWVDLPGPLGIGPCPPGYRCLGLNPLGICVGGCIPDTGGGGGAGLQEPPPSQPQAPTIPAAAAAAGGCCPAGYHLNKSGYHLLSGIYVPPGSRCVKNRRQNPLNPRAAHRAGTRLRSAAKAAKWLAKVEVPKRRR